MKRTIILEGPDESGKTTLAHGLSAITGASVIEIGPHPPTREAVLLFCETFLEAVSHGVIMDRCTPMSELVYRQVFGGEVVTPAELHQVLYAAHDKAAPVFVQCRPSVISPPVVKRDYDTPAGVERLQRSFLKVLQVYDDLFIEMAQNGFIILQYDYLTMTVDSLAEEIEKCLTSIRS